MDDLVVVDQLCKQFGSLKALDGLTLHIPRGLIFGLVGPNGSGKTTLIRVLLGLLAPTSGTVEVLGDRWPAISQRARIGYMPQLEGLYLDLTVEENTLFFASIYGLRGGERHRRIKEVLELADLADRRRTKVEFLSGGLRQRLSLACALLHEPELLLLDEPTVGVDPQLRQTFWQYFHELGAKGCTLIVSTHYLEEANHCQQLALLHFGRLLIKDTPAAIRIAAGEESLEKAFLKLSQEVSRVH
ncbi:MAG: ABC transporter ATP-binding protein [Coprothermobacterota bacterium]|nr:ABC transporter ATP-binding protein [Coprothermobacterota bacterium]